MDEWYQLQPVMSQKINVTGPIENPVSIRDTSFLPVEKWVVLIYGLPAQRMIRPDHSPVHPSL